MPLNTPPIASAPLYARNKATGNTYLVGPPAMSEVEVAAAEPTGNWELWVDTSATGPMPPAGGGDYLTSAGGTLTGPLVLAADPVAPLEASTKSYVDRDTGWLDISGLYINGWTGYGGIRRTGSTVWFYSGASHTNVPGGTTEFVLPHIEGFSSTINAYVPTYIDGGIAETMTNVVSIAFAGEYVLAFWGDGVPLYTPGHYWSSIMSWVTDDPWPTVLPGPPIDPAAVTDSSSIFAKRRP